MGSGLSFIDWAVVGSYLGLVALVGLYASRAQKETQDFFLGGRSLPWWAATLSIIATETSAVTYIGTPGIAYDGDWAFLQLVLGLVLGRVFLGLFLVPVFYRQEILTVYAFLETRYGNPARVAAAVLFLGGRLIGSGVRLYAGCLAVQVATGLPLSASVLILGALAMVYALAGGIRAVVWTDVLLGVTFIAGGVASAVFLATSFPGGIAELLGDAELPAKMAVLHPGVGLGSPNTFLAGLAGGFVLTLATHGTDQDIVQRIFTCGGKANGKRSILGTAVLILPLMALFLLVGTLLYFFYRASPPSYELPADSNHIFPTFIVKELPTGLSGFVMAGLFAASISSFASVLNALASTTLTDIYGPLRKALGREATQETLLRRSRLVAFVWGVLLLVVALGFEGSSDNVLKLALKVLMYFYGAILGTFLLGAFTRRGSNLSVILGMALSCAVVLLLQIRDFLADLELAPESLRGILTRIPPEIQEGILAHVPAVAWPYWVVVGTALSFGVGILGSRGLVVR